LDHCFRSPVSGAHVTAGVLWLVTLLVDYRRGLGSTVHNSLTSPRTGASSIIWIVIFTLVYLIK